MDKMHIEMVKFRNEMISIVLLGGLKIRFGRSL